MSKTTSLTAAGVISETNIILFGASVSSETVGDPAAVPPVNPPSGAIVVTIRDATAADGTGSILARFVVGQEGGMQSITFPAGVRVTEGIAVNITNSSPEPHYDFLIVLDYS